MTRASNILIPAQFVFRPFCARWEMTSASIVGWAEVPFPRLAAMANGGKWVFNPQLVVIRIAIPSTEPKGISAMLYGLGEYDSYDLELNRSDIPPDCLKPHENPETAPDIAGRDFELLVCRLPDTDALDSSFQPGESVRDAWDMREDFFTLQDDAVALRDFLNRWGLWSFERHYELGKLKPYPFVIALPHSL